MVHRRPCTRLAPINLLHKFSHYIQAFQTIKPKYSLCPANIRCKMFSRSLFFRVHNQQSQVDRTHRFQTKKNSSNRYASHWDLRKYALGNKRCHANLATKRRSQHQLERTLKVFLNVVYLCFTRWAQFLFSNSLIVYCPRYWFDCFTSSHFRRAIAVQRV